MKKLFKLLAVISCIVLMSTCADSPPPAELISARPYKTVQLLTVYSPAIADNLNGEKAERLLTVFLPPDYHSSGRSYPVVYFMHGYGYSVLQIVDCAPEILNHYFKEHPEDGFILVGIDGRNKYDGSFWANSPITGRWEDHVVREVPAIINETFHTKTGSENTGISGFSMGGFAAIHIGMRYPELFGHIHSISPPLYIEPIEVKKGTRMKAIICAFAPEYILGETGENIDSRELSRYVDQLVPEERVVSMIDQNFGKTYLTELVAEYTKSKVMKSKNLSQRISIEYGRHDRKSFVRSGSEGFSDLLRQNGIAHELTVFEGGHAAGTRIEPSFLPFFVEGFAKD